MLTLKWIKCKTVLKGFLKSLLIPFAKIYLLFMGKEVKNVFNSGSMGSIFSIRKLVRVMFFPIERLLHGYVTRVCVTICKCYTRRHIHKLSEWENLENQPQI